MTKKVPCQDCPNRTIHCHSTCKDYDTFKKLSNLRRAKLREYTNFNAMIYDMLVEKSKRLAKKKRR